MTTDNMAIRVSNDHWIVLKGNLWQQPIGFLPALRIPSPVAPVDLVLPITEREFPRNRLTPEWLGLPYRGL